MLPVLSAMSQCSCARGNFTERDIDDVGFCKQRAHFGQRRTAAQQPGDQLKLGDVAFAILRRVVDCIADKVQPCDAQALLIDGVIVERVLPAT